MDDPEGSQARQQLLLFSMMASTVDQDDCSLPNWVGPRHATTALPSCKDQDAWFSATALNEGRAWESQKGSSQNLPQGPSNSLQVQACFCENMRALRTVILGLCMPLWWLGFPGVPVQRSCPWGIRTARENHTSRNGEHQVSLEQRHSGSRSWSLKLYCKVCAWIVISISKKSHQLTQDEHLLFVKAFAQIVAVALAVT